MYEGERAMTRDNIFLTHLELTGIPPAPRGQQLFEVTLAIDVLGTVTVSAETVQSGKLGIKGAVFANNYYVI